MDPGASLLLLALVFIFAVFPVGGRRRQVSLVGSPGGGGPLVPDGFDSLRRCKGRSVPKPDKRQARLQQRLLRAQIRNAEKKIKPPELPPIPEPEAPPPPPDGSSSDAVQAAQDEKRKAARRVNRGRNTLFAGETGGVNLGGRKTLLG